MFVPSLIHHQASQFSSDSHVPEIFGVLCWNIHKKNTVHSQFYPYLENFIKEQNVDFLLLQEASFRDKRHCVLSGFSFDAAANLEIKGNFYGVLSASRVESKKAWAYLSVGKESFLGTHKSLLMSVYPLKDGSTLLILNVHAINFRENGRYNKEMERVFALLQAHEGPMIIAGDFNTWNKKRMRKLHEVREKLSLTMVPFKGRDKVKSFFGNHLDFILYREMELLTYKVDTNHGISDHNPLYAQFRKK